MEAKPPGRLSASTGGAGSTEMWARWKALHSFRSVPREALL